MKNLSCQPLFYLDIGGRAGVGCSTALEGTGGFLCHQTKPPLLYRLECSSMQLLTTMHLSIILCPIRTIIIMITWRHVTNWNPCQSGHCSKDHPMFRIQDCYRRGTPHQIAPRTKPRTCHQQTSIIVIYPWRDRRIPRCSLMFSSQALRTNRLTTNTVFAHILESSLHGSQKLLYAIG